MRTQDVVKENLPGVMDAVTDCERERERERESQGNRCCQCDLMMMIMKYDEYLYVISTS